MYIDQIGEPNAQIFNIHMMMLDDEDYCDSITGMITDGHVNAEYAVEQTSEVFAKMLESMDNEYMRARSADIRDVCQRLISNLSGVPRDFGDIPENAVVCADDITPTEAALLEQRNIAAFVTAFGSPISHTAILAHSMDIPAVIGTGSDLLARAKDGDEVIVDGFAGQVILSPDPDARSRLDAKRRARTSTAADQETRTLDGKRVTMLACDTTQIPEYADGIAVLDCHEIENEDQQYEFYRSIAEIADYSKAVIRLADKPLRSAPPQEIPGADTGGAARKLPRKPEHSVPDDNHRHGGPEDSRRMRRDPQRADGRRSGLLRGFPSGIHDRNTCGGDNKRSSRADGGYSDDRQRPPGKADSGTQRGQRVLRGIRRGTARCSPAADRILCAQCGEERRQDRYLRLPGGRHLTDRGIPPHGYRQDMRALLPAGGHTGGCDEYGSLRRLMELPGVHIMHARFVMFAQIQSETAERNCSTNANSLQP